MACYYPRTMYRSKSNDGTYTFDTKTGHIHSGFPVKCQQCWGCRLDRSGAWAVRCMDEAQMHNHNQFITLTYNNENIPNNNSLHKPHLTNFWKRLRQLLARNPELGLCEYDITYKKNRKGILTKRFKPIIKYYSCGEYGDETYRPHYHAVIFGLNLPDKKYHSHNNGNNLYTSKAIERLWTHGHAYIGDVTFESAAYVARYIMKKTLGIFAHTDYEIIDSETGKIIGTITPEYSAMSKGIGEKHYEQFKSDIYSGTNGIVIVRGGHQRAAPIYYDNKFQEENPKRMEQIKKRRQKNAKANRGNATRSRLITREKLAISIITKKLPRTLTTE